MASPLKVLAEFERQASEQDANFVKKMLFFFELRVDSGIAPAGIPAQFLFPLVVGPESYSMSEPFSVEKTPTRGGGLFVEENGIIMRTIRLKGNTGFRPRPFPVKGGPSSAQAPGALLLKTENRSFDRVLPAMVLAAISGQRHFQYLQDAVFRVYGDLKNDPQTSKGTHLYFHNPKDSEAWLVVPENFVLSRSKEKRVLYEYDIELTAVAPAKLVNRSFSEDKPLLDSIKDALHAVDTFAGMAAGFVDDATATLAEVGSLVSGVDTVIDNLSTLITAADDFAAGLTSLIEAPFALVISVAEGIEAVTDTLVNTVSGVLAIPTPYVNAWKRLGQAVDRLGMFPSLFETDAQRSLREIQIRQQTSNRQQQEASAQTAPGTISGFGTLGTTPLPGAAQRAKVTSRVGVGINRYSAAKAVTVSQGDTLVSLASTYLGDARLWQDIALLNGLKAPYLDTMASQDLGGPDNPIPGILGAGASILIPTFGVAPQALPLLPVLGVAGDRPHAEQLLGTDFQVALGPDGYLDWVVDTEHGSTDLKLARGVDNLSQALSMRLSVEKGSNPLYRALGLDRVVGLGNATVDTQTARLRVVDALEADPRVASVRRLTIGTGNADTLTIDADVAVRGFSQGVTAQAIGVL